MDIRHFNIKKAFETGDEKFKWYFGLIYLLIIAIPLNHKEAFSIYDPDLIWSKFVLVGLAAVGLFYFVKNYKLYIRDPFLLLLLSFIVFQILSLTQTRDVTSSIRMITFQSAIAFAYVPVKNFLMTRKDGLKDLIFLCGIVFIPVVIFLIVQIYLQTNFHIAIGGVWPVPGYPTRYGSTFWDINHFGAYCSALSLILIGYASSKDTSLKYKIFGLAVLLCALAALYLTSSRSSMLGFISGAAVLVILTLRNRKSGFTYKLQYQALYLGVISTVSVFLYGLYMYADPIKESLRYRSVSFFSHLFLLKVGITVGIHNALFGIGTNSFHAYFRETDWAKIYYYIDRAALNLKLPLHNLWLEVLAETGLVSFSFFVVFWILLLVGLYRVYSENNDKLALGLMGAIVSFLVGGFMYSYKSEFFWMFVLISAAYVAKYYFMDKKVNPLTAGSKVLCPHNCDVSRVVLFVLSILVLVAPILFIIHPLDAFEVKSFSGAFKPNILVDSYTKLLLLLKYIIGNYTYTGRLLSEIFYAGSVSLAFLIVKRYAGNYYSVVIVSLLAGVSNIWEPALLVSIKWFIVFLILAVIGFFIFLMSFINKDAQIFTFSKKNNIYLIAFAILILIGGGVSNSTYFKKSYPENLTFLLELAYNRGFMDRALVQVGENIDLNSVYYFADDVQKDEKGLYNLEGTVIPISGFDLDNYSKNLFIYTSDDAYEVQKLMDLLESDSASYEINELNLGEYNLVLVERRSSPPMASDQPQ